MSTADFNARTPEGIAELVPLVDNAARMATIHQQPAGEPYPLVSHGLNALIVLGLLASLGILSGFLASNTKVVGLGIAFLVALTVVYVVLRRRRPVLWLGDDGVFVRRARDEFVPYHAVKNPSVVAVESKGDVVHWDLHLIWRTSEYTVQTYDGKRVLSALQDAIRKYEASQSIDTSTIDRILTEGGPERIHRLHGLLEPDADIDSDRVQNLLAVVEHPAVRPSQRAAAAIALRPRDQAARSRISAAAHRTAVPLLRTTLERSYDSTTDPIDLGAALDSLVAMEQKIRERHRLLPWRFSSRREENQPYRVP